MVAPHFVQIYIQQTLKHIPQYFFFFPSCCSLEWFFPRRRVVIPPSFLFRKPCVAGGAKKKKFHPEKVSPREELMRHKWMCVCVCAGPGDGKFILCVPRGKFVPQFFLFSVGQKLMNGRGRGRGTKCGHKFGEKWNFCQALRGQKIRGKFKISKMWKTKFKNFKKMDGQGRGLGTPNVATNLPKKRIFAKPWGAKNYGKLKFSKIDLIV